MGNLPKRIAIVYDSVNKWGGAEVVLTALHQLYPDAPLFTAVYNSKTAGWANIFPQVIPSFLQKFPLAKSHRDYYPYLTPLAFETLDLRDFDAVISVTSADAKGIITSPNTFHFCYCLTPTRYLWSHYKEYKQQVPFPLRPFSELGFNYLKRWDLIAAARPDVYAAISKTVQTRISDYYHRESHIIYPPADLEQYATETQPLISEPYYLYVGRLVSYKNPELIVRAFSHMQKKLVVVGTGPLEKKLKAIAGPTIQFVGFATSTQLASYYQHAKALVFFHEEDYGIVPVEAQSVGLPVIGIKRGGVSETVISGKTGILVDKADSHELVDAIENFNLSDFDVEYIKTHALQFSKERFLSRFAKVFTEQWIKFNNTYTS